MARFRWMPAWRDFSWGSVKRSFSWTVVGLLGLAAGVGAVGIIAAVEFNKHTSTDAFCTGCHSMSSMTADPHYQQSPHVANSAGVRPSCGTCHIPTNNFFLETWVHVSSGIRDVISEATTNFDDKAAWEAKRRQMAKGVPEHMRAWGNTTCTSCHTPASIKPASQTGQVIHASLPGDMACASCHRKLVHSRPGSISSADEQKLIKHATDDFVHARHLANLHAQKGLTCSSCHGNDLLPDANATGPNAACATCHGGMEKVAQNHKGASYLNPHASHLGNIPCASCHAAHKESKPYCLNCHSNFDMPIPGGAAKTAADAAKQ
jgi:nitrate/TMAO reductase-like tetraheme cytochrome c subunit